MIYSQKEASSLIFFSIFKWLYENEINLRTYADLFHVDNYRVKNYACSIVYIVNTMYRTALTCAEVGFEYSLKRLSCKGLVVKNVEGWMFHKGSDAENQRSKFKTKQWGMFFLVILVICCTFKLYICLPFHHIMPSKSWTSIFLEPSF